MGTEHPLTDRFAGFDEDREGKAIIVSTDAEHNYGRRPNRPLERAWQNTRLTNHNRQSAQDRFNGHAHANKANSVETTLMPCTSRS